MTQQRAVLAPVALPVAQNGPLAAVRIAIAWCSQCGANMDTELVPDGCITTTDARQTLLPGGMEAPRWLPSALLQCPHGHLILRLGYEAT